MLSRIIGAFTFQRGVYEEVEKDQSFTTTAWILVIVIAFLNQLGATASSNLVNWLIGAVIGTIFAIVGFALGAFVISWVGKTVFGAKTDFGEMVRCLGLAYVWNIIGLIGIVAVISEGLACIVAPLALIGILLMIVAWFIAVKAALDLDWIRTIVTVVIGWIVVFLINLVAGAVLGMLGLAAAGAAGMIPAPG